MSDGTFEKEIAANVANFTHDPLGYVLFAFPWGVEGTELQHHTGPRDWQRTELNELGEQLRKGQMTTHEAILRAISSGHGIGKGNRVQDAFKKCILSTSNKQEVDRMQQVRWGDLKVGDYVLGADGKPTKITQTKHYRREHFRVTFDDRSSVVVSGEHLWNVRGRQERRKKLDTWRTLSTEEILTLGVKRKNGKAMARQWEIPTQGIAQFSHKDVYHPYTVGVWLGDGSATSAKISSSREEIWSRIGCKPSRSTVRYLKDGAMSANPPGLHDALTELKMAPVTCDTKFIPDCYKYNSERVRRAIVSGMLDTDGEVHKSGSIGFSSTSKQLVDDLMWLVRSLSGKAMLHPSIKKGAYNKDGVRHECKDCYRLTINFGGKWNPFTHTYKKLLLPTTVQDRYTARWIDSIESVGLDDGMCITVAAKDSLYLTDDFHVTHNSAFVSWLIMWAMSTFEDTKGVVTANTENQLKTKTWAEVAKWHRLAINSHWFKFTATALFSTDPYHEKTWRIDMVPWSERNTESFAGLHNEGKRILIIFDEASAILDKIWEVTEGALTDEDTEIIWAVFGNPTRNVGRFRECFRRYRHRWSHKSIDSRTVAGTNKNQHKKWIDDYGIDSDFVKVRVLGEFPSASDMQLISSEVLRRAMDKQPYYMPDDPLIMSIDVARGGADNCIIRYRRGLHAYPLQKIKLLGSEMRDSMKFAAIIAKNADQHRPDAIFIDATGVGGPVGDRLRQLGYDCIDVQFAAKSPNPKYANMRAYMYMKLEQALRDGLAVEDDGDLETELLAIEYTHDKQDRIILTPKEKIKEDIGVSPDDGDALAISYAYPVAPTSNDRYGNEGSSHESDYDPLGG